MPLVKPAAPPGVMSQATQVQARGAWFAMNRARWRTGLLEKMAGWRRLIDDAMPHIVRRMHAWLDIDSRKNLLIATDGGPFLKVQDTMYPLTRESPLPFGNPQKNAWFLSNLGKDGLVLASGGPLEVYNPPIENGAILHKVGVGPPATAPQRNNGMLTAMPQAQVILWGSEAIMGSGVIDPLLIRFSNVGTYDQYTATASNQAGSYRLSRGAKIMGAIQAPQATLILTDTDLWQMSYIGPPLIYGFTIMGSGCGLVAPHAIGTIGRVTVWQGKKNFWMFDTALQPVQCTVWDYIFEDVDTVNINKCHAAPNSTTNELVFYFPSKQTIIELEPNLLLQSQLFSDPGAWVTVGASAGPFVAFDNLYVYEECTVQLGWLDNSSIVPVSWFDDDVQGKVSTANLISAPDGSGTAFNLAEAAVNGEHYVGQTIDKADERTTYTLSIYAHQASTRNLTLRASVGGEFAYATFNVQLGNRVQQIESVHFQILSSRVITADDPLVHDGWRRYVLTFTTNDDPTLSVSFNLTNGTVLSYLGAPPNGALIWGAQLVVGGDPLPYSKTGVTRQQNETKRYVKINTAEGMAWDPGELPRSAWLDESVWGMPLGADITPVRVTPEAELTPKNVIQQHEIGFDDDGEPMQKVYAETGYTELGDGTMVMLIDECHPDMKWFGLNGGVDIYLRAANYPQGPSHLYGPFPITPTTKWFNPRVRARYVAVRYEWMPKLGFGARVGATTFHVKSAGRMP